VNEPAPTPPGPRLHPVDLLVLVAAAALTCVAYAYLFRRSPVPRPVDPLLGKELLVEFAEDRDWKSAREFLRPGHGASLEDYLEAEVVGEGPPAPERPGTRRVRLRIGERKAQRPEAITLFRTGIRRGTRVRVTSRRSEVEAEVLEAPGPEAAEPESPGTGAPR
jgi:hypothetical protein